MQKKRIDEALAMVAGLTPMQRMFTLGLLTAHEMHLRTMANELIEKACHVVTEAGLAEKGAAA